jgi:hypothetical protein
MEYEKHDNERLKMLQKNNSEEGQEIENARPIIASRLVRASVIGLGYKEVQELYTVIRQAGRLVPCKLHLHRTFSFCWLSVVAKLFVRTVLQFFPAQYTTICAIVCAVWNNLYKQHSRIKLRGTDGMFSFSSGNSM